MLIFSVLTFPKNEFSAEFYFNLQSNSGMTKLCEAFCNNVWFSSKWWKEFVLIAYFFNFQDNTWLTHGL